MSSSQEQQKSVSQDHSIEIGQSAAQQLEMLNKAKNNPELLNEKIKDRTEKARLEVMRTAVSVEAKGKNIEKSNDQTVSSHYRGTINNKQRDASYKRTLKQIQNELPLNSRILSKFTHNSIIEKTSDIVANTIARPNAMLSGAIFAFILTLITYTIAKIVGYALSGFETIAAFIVGWIIGIIFDYLKALFTGSKF